MIERLWIREHGVYKSLICYSNTYLLVMGVAEELALIFSLKLMWNLRQIVDASYVCECTLHCLLLLYRGEGQLYAT